MTQPETAADCRRCRHDERTRGVIHLSTFELYPPDHADDCPVGLRDRIAAAVQRCTEEGNVRYGHIADAVLAVLPASAGRAAALTETADRAAVSAALWAAAEHNTVAEWICCEPINPKHDLCAQGGVALQMLKALLVDDPEAWKPAPLLDTVMSFLPPAGSAVDAHRLALSEALDLGTGAPWDAIHERMTELRRLAAEAHDGDGPSMASRIRNLHQPMQRGPFTICAHCSGWDGKWQCRGVVTDYPCPTVRALEGTEPAAVAVHLGGKANAEDCPGCKAERRNLPYPFLCPAPSAVLPVGSAEPQDETRVREVVHGCPPDGSGLTPCCGRTPFELPRTDRISSEAPVTCAGGEAPGG